jgi:hypothetical protein
MNKQKNMNKQTGPSKNVIDYYHKRANDDYNKLTPKDQKIIDEIDKLIKSLSENGRDYWQTYYS